MLGFTGSDNQGIVGLESKYDKYLSGESGKILTLTDAWGIEIEGSEENREEPDSGMDLYTSIDINIVPKSIIYVILFMSFVLIISLVISSISSLKKNPKELLIDTK